MTEKLLQALSRLTDNRHSDGVSSIVSHEDRSIIISGCHDLMLAARQAAPPENHVASAKIWNVAADDENGHSQIMCVDWQTRADAQKSVDHYVQNYVGKPYPNGKGHYTINNVRLIREEAQ